MTVDYLDNPDAADPKNDNKYNGDEVTIEIADMIRGVIVSYRVVAFIHTHPNRIRL